MSLVFADRDRRMILLAVGCGVHQRLVADGSSRCVDAAHEDTVEIAVVGGRADA